MSGEHGHDHGAAPATLEMVAAGADSHAVLDRTRELLAERHRIAHSTLQVEADDHRGCQDVSW